MNKGISLACGDVVGIINIDDWYENDAVEKAVRCFEREKAEVVYGEIWLINENGQREYRTVHSIFSPHPDTFMKRVVYEKYGLFDTAYRIAADRDLLSRLMTEDIRFVYINEILANFRMTGISNTRNLVCTRATYEINLKYLGKCSASILNRNDIEKSYNRSKLLYISHKYPQAIREAFGRRCNISDGLIIFGAGNYGTGDKR